MKKLSKLLVASTIIGTLIPNIAFANAEGDISMTTAAVRFSDNYLLEGKTVRIYATATNSGTKDLLGTVKFINENTGEQISSDQPISLFSEKTDDVFVDWTPKTYGTYKIAVKVVPWNPEIDDPSNNEAKITANVLKDTDKDGLSDQDDPDDDNDSSPDETDKFPLDKNEWEDTDGDSIGDNADTDDDNDGILDEQDSFPKNPMESEDTDKDGLGNNIDEDDDNDGITDAAEQGTGTNPLISDSDGDTVKDKEDAFPLNEKEWSDYDKDGIGNNADTDDDDDEILDEEDFDPQNKGPIIILDKKPRFVRVKSPILLDASDSYDEDGKITKIEWEINGKKMESEKIEQIFENTGKYVVKLIATDNKGETRSMTMTINAVNYTPYLQIVLLLILIALALIIFFQYIRAAGSKTPLSKKR